MTFNLGDKVLVSHRLEKIDSYETLELGVWVKAEPKQNPYSRESRYARDIRRWTPVAYHGEPLLGVVHGWRTLSDGYTKHDYDEGTIFIPVGKYTKAYLVTFNMREKPVYVLSEHMSFDQER